MTPKKEKSVKQEGKSIEDVIREMKLRFTSSNGIPVERAAIKADEWSVVLKHLKAE